MIEKISPKKIAYLIVISRLFDVSWEWLFLFFCAFSFVNLPNGGTLTALIFINCALTRAIFSRKIAVITQKMQNKLRLTISIYCRSLSVFAFALLPVIFSHFYLLFLWVIAISILFILDEYLTFGLRYVFNDKKYISITRFNSIFNLGKRGSIAISSVVAYMLGANNWYGLSYIFIFFAVFGLLISLVTRAYFGNIASDKFENDKKVLEAKKTFIFSGIEYNERWLLPIYLFLMNLFFSSIALLFSRAVLEYKLVIFGGVNIITFFYSGFVVFNIFALFFDDFFEKLYKTRHLMDCYLFTVLMSFIIYLFRDHLVLCFSSVLVFGMIYGFTLSCFFSLTAVLIRGKEQNRLYATIDVSGRIGMVISQLVTGLLLDYHYNPLSIMQGYALLALSMAVIFIIFHSQKIMRLRNNDQTSR